MYTQQTQVPVDVVGGAPLPGCMGAGGRGGGESGGQAGGASLSTQPTLHPQEATSQPLPRSVCRLIYLQCTLYSLKRLH